MFNKELFSSVFKLQRLLNGHTLAEVSEITKVSVPTLHRTEQGICEPRVGNAMAICRYMGVPIDIFSESNLSSPSKILSTLPTHIFASMAQYLTPEQFNVLSVIIKRYNNVVTLFDHIKEEAYDATELNFENDNGIKLRHVFKPLTFISPNNLELTLEMGENGNYKLIVNNTVISIEETGLVTTQKINTH